MNINLSKKAKIIIGVVVGVLVVAGVIGGSIAIANAVKKNKQSKCEHVYDEGQITAEATCEDPGMIVYTCGECKYQLTEEIPANGHVESIIEALPATCTAKGLTDGVKCVTCEEILVTPVETPMLGHKVTALKAVPATCTTAGKTEGSFCSRCDEVLKAQTVIPAKGHNVVEVKGYEATCTEVGKTTGSKCLTCGKVYSEQEDIPATGHNVVNDVCTICGAKAVELYANYTETTITSDTKAAGNVFRIYKHVNTSQVDGNFVTIRKSFKYSSTEYPDDTFTANNIYVGILSDGRFVASFEPIIAGYGVIELTSENTTIKVYESDDYYEVVINAGDTINFEGGFAQGGGSVLGTFEFDSTTTVGTFGDKVYLLVAPTGTANLDSGVTESNE